MSIQTLLKTLEADSMMRLRWRVDRLFGIVPGSAQDRDMSDADVLLCGMHMALDNISAQAAADENAQFDDDRFLELRRGRP